MVEARLIGVAFLLVGLVLGIASISIDYWYHRSAGGSDDKSGGVFFGLWELCSRSVGTDVCVTWKELNDGHFDIDWIHGCQAMMIIGAFLNTAAVFGIVVASIERTAARGAQFAAGVGGICYIIAAIIFSGKYEDSLLKHQTGGELHAGFALAIVAGIFNLMSIRATGQVPTGAGYQIV